MIKKYIESIEHKYGSYIKDTVANLVGDGFKIHNTSSLAKEIQSNANLELSIVKMLISGLIASYYNSDYSMHTDLINLDKLNIILKHLDNAKQELESLKPFE